jgi:hypothetical protein
MGTDYCGQTEGREQRVAERSDLYDRAVLDS